MADLENERNILLAAARERGTAALGSTILPPGLDHFTVYAGLIGSALDLAKLIQTEDRDLKVIDAHYQIEVARIAAAFKEVEAAMIGDFERDRELRDRTFESINLLITAGQYEIASEFHKRLIEGFKRPALEAIIEHRNTVARAGTSRLSLK